MVCAAYHSSTSRLLAGLSLTAYRVHTSAGNMTPFCGKGMCCDPPPIDKAAALKAGNAKAPMMKMMKREPYKVDS